MFYDAIEKFIKLRYHLMPYIYSLAGAVHFNDYTIMRSLLFDFPEDKEARKVENEFMFGPSLLICAVTEPMYYGPESTELHREKTWKCYLPAGSLFADFFSTTVSGCLGSVPTTTYGENIGVMAVTKVYSVQVIGGAAVLSICCSFLGKLAALISTIPGPVIGGISFLLYGMIGTSGLRMLVDNHVDYSKSRNLTLTSVVFVVGLSGIALKLGNVELTGMVLACVVAMALSLVFYILDKLKLTNDQ